MGKVYAGYDENGKLIRKNIYGKDRKEVADKIRKFQNQEEAQPGVFKKQLVSDFITEWLFNVNKINLKQSSFDRNESTMRNQIIPRVGKHPIAKLDAMMIQNDVINKMMGEGYSHSSVKKAHDLLNQCLRYATRNRKIPFNPMEAVIMPSKDKFEKKEIVYYTEEERDMIAAIAEFRFGNGKPLYHYGPMLTFMLYTGIRPGEACALKWDCIDWEKREMVVRRNAVVVKNRDKDGDDDSNYVLIVQESTKNGKQRTIHLSDTALRALKVLKTNLKQYNSEFVMTTKNGEPVRPRHFRNVLDAVLKRAGLKEGGLHSMRHTFATILFSKGVSVKVVSELLGHSSVQVTQDIYIHVIPEDKVDAIKLLDAANSLNDEPKAEAASLDVNQIMDLLKPLNSKQVQKMMKTLDFLRNVDVDDLDDGDDADDLDEAYEVEDDD